MADTLEADDSGVYWSMTWALNDERNPGECYGAPSILKVSQGGGEVVEVSDGYDTGHPMRIALSAGHVYYMDRKAGAILRIPKR